MTCFWRNLNNLDQLCDADGPVTESNFSVWNMSAYGGVYKMALSSNRMIVANYAYGSGNGRAWILDLSANLQATLNPSGYASTSNFGNFLAYDGTNFLVGVIAADYGGRTDRGVIDVFNSSGTWQNRMTTSTGSVYDYFGTDICSDGTSFFAPGYSNYKLMKFNSGYTAISQTAIPNAYGAERHQTAVIASGYLVTGGYTASYGGYSQNGVLRVWSTTPTYQRLCIHPYPNNNAYMGRPLVSTGTYAVAGAHGTTVSGITNAGMVLFFNPANGNCVNYIDMTAAGLTLATNSYFGYSLYYHSATSSLFVSTADTICEFAVSGFSVTHTKNYVASGHTINAGGFYGLPSNIIANSTKVYSTDQSGNIIVWTR